MAMPLDANRVAETSTTVGTGALTLGGAVVGHQTFAQAFGVSENKEVWYEIIQDVTGEREEGIGTFLATQNKLQRDLVHSSSDGASKVSFPTGSKIVYVAVPAEGVRRLRATRSTDTVFAVHGAAGQTANLFESYDNDGDLAVQISSVGTLYLTENNVQMARIPMAEAGAYVGLLNSLLGSPSSPGIRYRMTGTGTDGIVQWSEGDTSYIQLDPSTGQIRASQGAGAGGGAGDGVGLTFVNGLKLLGNNAESDGVALGHIGFDCQGGSGASIWDISPANNTGSATHTVRIGRRSGTSTKVELTVVLPGTTTPRVTLDSTGRVEALYGDFGNYKIGMGPSGAADATLISSDTDAAFIARSGISGDGAFFFRDVGGTLLARIDAADTDFATIDTVATRRNGDARWTAISSARFKEEIADRHDLVEIFQILAPKGFTWGGEVPKTDERRGTDGVGFIAEDVVRVFPEAGRYIRVGEGKRAELVLNGLDPLAICAVLHAKGSELDQRLADLAARMAALEGAKVKPTRRRR